MRHLDVLSDVGGCGCAWARAQLGRWDAMGKNEPWRNYRYGGWRTTTIGPVAKSAILEAELRCVGFCDNGGVHYPFRQKVNIWTVRSSNLGLPRASESVNEEDGMRCTGEGS